MMPTDGSDASKKKLRESLQNFTAGPLFDWICSKIGKQMLKLQADACFHPSLTLPQHLHLILPIQPFYIFITGVGNAKTIPAPSAIWGRWIKTTKRSSSKKRKITSKFPLHHPPSSFGNILIESRFRLNSHLKAADVPSRHEPRMSTTVANVTHFHHSPLFSQLLNKQQESGWGISLFSYLLGESTAGVKLQATCHKEQVYFSGISGNPGKCEARLFGQAGLRAGLATVLPGGLSSPAAPLSVEGKWEAPQPRPYPPTPHPPSSPPQTTVHTNPSFPVKHRRISGGVSRPVGFLVRFGPNCQWMCAHTELLAPCCARQPVRPQISAFPLRKWGRKTRNLNQPRQLRCHQNAFRFFPHEFVEPVPETWSHTRLLFVCRSRETCVDICAQMQCR